MGLTILQGKTRPRITKDMAHCVMILLPTRPVRSPSGLILSEIPQHWEQLSSNGCVVRCHTQLEAMEAAQLMEAGIAAGQFLAVGIAPYDPTPDDLPYHQWVRGERGRKLKSLGLSEADLPEAQDESLAHISDDDWIANGPR